MKNKNAIFALICLLVVVVIFAVGVGALHIAPLQVVSILIAKLGVAPLAKFDEQQEAVLMAIRLPRVVQEVLVGAGLAVSGAALQGLFRNPLADPGLLGVSSGASVFVAASIVLGIRPFGQYSLPVAAFIGSALAITLIYALSQHNRKTDIATMLLAGIAINAVCSSGTGFFTFLSNDEQLRTITFWQLGSLGSATWTSVVSVAPFILLCVFLMPWLGSPLNALLLGENNARHLGISVEMIKVAIVALVAIGVGARVAVSGMIGFVGLVITHLIRMCLGPNHRTLLPASALLGSILLVLADLFARTVVLAKKRAVLPQSTHLSFDYRVLDVVLLGRIPHQKRQVETSEEVSISQNCLHHVGLKGYENRSYLTHSGGEQQRVHLARTLAQLQGTSGPRLLFLDEPTSSLDLAHQHHILGIAKELTTESVGVLAVLHDLNLTAQYADRIVVMSEGRVLACGTPREVLTENILLEAFHYNVIITEHPCFDCPLVVAGQPISIDAHR